MAWPLLPGEHLLWESREPVRHGDALCLVALTSRRILVRVDGGAVAQWALEQVEGVEVGRATAYKAGTIRPTRFGRLVLRLRGWAVTLRGELCDMLGLERAIRAALAPPS